MMFTSFKFLLFIVIVFLLYWFVFKRNYKQQNILLLIASYVFYGLAEWKMLPLLLATTLIFYFLAIGIHKAKNAKTASLLTTLGAVLGVGILLYFKYFNFFILSFSDFFNAIGLQTNWHTFKIIMPLGVSYFTFKLISYVVEVHRGKMEPCTDVIAFANYVAFFPTIMAGPIDRPQKFIPQLLEKRTFTYYGGVDGLQQIIWGLFKKTVIADNLSPFVDNVWANLDTSSGSTILLALMLYSFQMYTDFSGYSDMAIGVGKLLGIRIQKNFNYPFFATNIAEFWRRWHISLTGWLTDYVFIPLNVKFRNWGNLGMILAIIINMVLVGMWHGANWTYAVFGLYQGVLFIPLILSGGMSKKQKLILNRWNGPRFVDVCKMLGIFMLYTIGTILFRAENINQSINVIGGILSTSLLSMPQGITSTVLMCISFIVLMLVVEWHCKKKEYVLQPNENIDNKPLINIVIIDLIMIGLVLLLGNFGANQFIYFQF